MRRRIGSFSPSLGCLSALYLRFFSRLSLSALSLGFSRSLPRFSAIFSWLLLTKMRQMALFGSASPVASQRASRRCYQPGSSSPLAVLRLKKWVEWALFRCVSSRPFQRWSRFVIWGYTDQVITWKRKRVVPVAVVVPALCAFQVSRLGTIHQECQKEASVGKKPVR